MDTGHLSRTWWGGRLVGVPCCQCMVGQGDSCACRGETPRARVSRRRVHITATEWLWLLIAADVACLWGAVKLVQVVLS